jgi:hypothetical protein
VDYVDNYCERVAPGLWGEPANALTNVAFLIACGLLFWLLVRQPSRVPVTVWLLPVTTAVVGLCRRQLHSDPVLAGAIALTNTLPKNRLRTCEPSAAGESIAVDVP